MRPIVGITTRMIVDEPWCPALVGVRRGYIDGVIEAGATPLLIPTQVDEQGLQQLYAMTDAILLPGGADIDPALYGEQAHPKLGAIEPLRDAVELPLARWAVADGKPLLAICRGIQALNVALGGTLYQDLNSQYTTSTEHEIGARAQCWEHPDHPLILEPDSRLAELLGTTHLEVNSLHHQALKDVAPQLRVVGRAPDDVIEAVEGTGEQFVVGVQCHPEQLWQTADPRWRRVFGAFVRSAQQWHAQAKQATAV